MQILPRLVLSLAALAVLGGCGVGHELGLGSGPDQKLGQTAALPQVFGYAVADEPEAAVVGRQILNEGGNAADAAAAIGFAMSVTLPSRAGLGGGGACVISMNNVPPVTLMFAPGAPGGVAGGRPAAVPEFARGLLAMQARYGQLPFASVIVPAERLAGSVLVSQALANDFAVVGGALLDDPAASSVFAGPGGGVLTVGQTMSQPDLAATLEVLRTQGVPGFYDGQFAARFVQADDAAGGGLTAVALNAVTPLFGAPETFSAHGADIAMLPVPETVSGSLPASAGFAALDKNGGAVACATTMDNLFGTGRIATGTGVLLAASPRRIAPAILAAGIATDGGRFRAAVTGTGQAGAAQAAVDGMEDALKNDPQTPVLDPERANTISCPGGVPGGEASCTAYADPRSGGLAVGGR